MAGAARPGDNRYTGSIVALNADTGKLVWGFQPAPHDTHDWDAVEIPVLVDGTFKGKPRKMLLQASRDGYFFVLDRVTGESLLTTPFGPVNWAKGIDSKGQPIPNPEKDPAQFPREADHLADCILQNKEPKTPGEEGLRDMKLMAAIYKSCGRPSLQ